jgi:hypothetical protein
MKRKVVNPDPQKKHTQQTEDKIMEHEMKEEIIKAEEGFEKKKKEKEEEKTS